MIKSKKVDLIVRTSIVMALTFVVTFFVNVPVGSGNVNLGDSIILVGALILPCLPLGFACGVGACLADLVSPYAIFAPFTLVIKFVEAIIVSLLYKLLKQFIKNQYFRFFVSSFVSVLIIPLGYFFANWIIGGLGAGVSDIPQEFIQAGGSLLVSNVLFFPLTKALKNVRTY